MKTVKGVDVDETFKSIDVYEISIVSSVVVESILHEQKLTLLTKQSCQPSKAVLSKRKKKIGKRD